jgi:hypothetical protein
MKELSNFHIITLIISSLPHYPIITLSHYHIITSHSSRPRVLAFSAFPASYRYLLLPALCALSPALLTTATLPAGRQAPTATYFFSKMPMATLMPSAALETMPPA